MDIRFGTRLRHIDGYSLIIPNQKLVSKNIINLFVRNTRPVEITANLKYGMAPDALPQLVARLKETLLATPPVMPPVDISVENFDADTCRLIISYNLPMLQEGNADLNTVKEEITYKIFDIINHNADIGAQKGGV